MKTTKKNIDYSLKKILLDIEELLYNSSISSANLFTGKSGVALYFFQRYVSTKKAYYLEQAFKLTDEIVQSLTSTTMPFNLNGSVGIIWFLNQLKKFDLLDLDDDFLESLNQQIFQEINAFFSTKNIDFFFGASGIALYILDSNSKRKKEYLSDIIDMYANISVTDNNGLFWLDKSGSLLGINYKKQEIINLGMSHGIPASIFIINEIYNLGINRVKCAHLLEKSVSWLLSNKNDNGLISTFPNYLPNDDKYSRLAWCYGDLSIAHVLINVGISLKNEKFYTEGINIINKTLVRVSLEQTSLSEPSICHGSFGVSYLFLKFYKNLKIKNYYDSSLFWADYSIKLVQEENANHRGVFANNDPSFLVGLSGIGLVINSFLHNRSKNIWDRILMLS